MRKLWLPFLTAGLLVASSTGAVGPEAAPASLPLEATDDPAVDSVVFEPYEDWQGEPRRLAFGPDGTVWVWDGSEVWQADDSGIVATGAPLVEVHDLASTLDGMLWAATRAGLYSYDGTTWERPWAGGAVYSLAVGPGGSLMGISGGMRGEPPTDVFHLLKFTGRSGSRWIVDGLSPVDQPSGVVVTPDGVAWIGAVRPGWGNVGLEFGDGVLLRFEDGAWSPVQPLGEDDTAGVSGIAVGPDGTLWVLLHRPKGPNTTQPSLARLVEDEWQTYTGDDGLPSDLGRSVGALAIDADGRVWSITGETGAPRGMAGFDGVSWARHLDGVPLSDLAVGPAGFVWAAGSDGIYVVRPAGASGSIRG